MPVLTRPWSLVSQNVPRVGLLRLFGELILSHFWDVPEYAWLVIRSAAPFAILGHR